MEHNRQTPGAVFRSISGNSSASLNSSSTNISRVPSGPIQGAFHTMSLNKQSSAEDHLHYQCLHLKQKLQGIKGMEPFLNLAFNSAEQCAEQQALALSQQLQQEGNINGDFRSSVGSAGFSINSDTSSATSISIGQSSYNSNIFTFTAGVLPANISVDPVTHMWKLFQQGAPLCLIFNSVSKDYQIPIVGSDDLRICKKSVYEFLIAVKMYLKFDDESMFTISNVFSENTHDLIKIVQFVNKIVDLNPTTSSVEFEIDHLNMGDLKLTDDARVFREIIETERKYVSDLELMLAYRNELRNAELISSEQIDALIPNLNEILDFQRRFLNGLECNIKVPNKYQRIGSVFLHAAGGPFKAYEPWTIGQIAAIDLITKESTNLKKSSSLLSPGFELQSYIIKPVQRLCKYPLLIRELLKTCPEYRDVSVSPSASYNELVLAETAMKEVANRVNEAQRRAENVGYLQSLIERVHNWRGFNLKDQGKLLHHGIVAVKDSDSEKEYFAYLFEKIIFFFVSSNKDTGKEKEKKKREILSSRKKSSGSIPSASTTNLLENLHSAKDKSILELKGRVYISEIYSISANPQSYTLVISWSGKKESGSFSLRYKTEEIRNQWETCLRNLKTNEMNNQIHRKLRDSHGSLGTNDSGYDVTAAYTGNSPQSTYVNDNNSLRSSSGSSFRRHDSSSSSFSMMRQSRSKSGTESSRQSSNGHSQYNNEYMIKHIDIKLIYNKIEIPETLRMPASIQFNELYHKISSKIASSEEITDDIVVNKLKYKDEDGDFVVLYSNDDWNLAVDMLDELYETDTNEDDIQRNLTIWVS